MPLGSGWLAALLQAKLGMGICLTSALIPLSLCSATPYCKFWQSRQCLFTGTHTSFSSRSFCAVHPDIDLDKSEVSLRVICSLSRLLPPVRILRSHDTNPTIWKQPSLAINAILIMTKLWVKNNPLIFERLENEQDREEVQFRLPADVCTQCCALWDQGAVFVKKEKKTQHLN